jgi:hypothetical protein
MDNVGSGPERLIKIFDYGFAINISQTNSSIRPLPLLKNLHLRPHGTIRALEMDMRKQWIRQEVRAY